MKRVNKCTKAEHLKVSILFVRNELLSIISFAFVHSPSSLQLYIWKLCKLMNSSIYKRRRWKLPVELQDELMNRSVFYEFFLLWMRSIKDLNFEFFFVFSPFLVILLQSARRRLLNCFYKSFNQIDRSPGTYWPVVTFWRLYWTIQWSLGKLW